MGKNLLAEMFEELRQSQYPIFILGAGSMSVEVGKRLSEQRIPVVGKFINIESAGAHIVSDGMQVFSQNEIMEKYESIDVVMGHGHYEKTKEIGDYSFVHKVYIIPNPYLQYIYIDSDMEFRRKNKNKIDYVISHLADEKSQLALEQYILVNETNDINQLLNYDICVGGGMYGLEELNIGYNEIFVDIGAWEGDTIQSFLKITDGKYKYIYGIEPELYSFEKLKSNLEKMKNMTLYQCGLGKEQGEFYLNLKGTQSFYLSEKENEGRVKVEVNTIDTLFEKKKVSLVKISVPFMYLNILEGGLKVIKENKPRILVNVAMDNHFSLYDVIRLLDGMNLNYKYALRFDFPMPTRLILYIY